MRGIIVASVLVACASSACAPDRATPLELQRVTAEAVQRLESGSTAEVEAPDEDTVRRARELVWAVSRQQGEMRSSFASQARELGEPVVTLLSVWVGDLGRSFEERRAAAEMLTAMDTPRSARALAFHAALNPQVWTRSTCAWLVGDTTQDQELVGLIEAWHAERVSEVRNSIEHALERFGCYAFARDRAVQQRWWVGASGAGMVAHEPSDRLRLETWRRIAALSDEDGPARELTITVLGSLPAFAAELLAAALRDVDVRVRRGAARALERMGPRGGQAGAALSESLHRDPEVTLEAICALGALHHQPAWEAIAARIGEGSPLAVRVAAARALGRLDVPRAVPALEGAQAAGNPPVLRATAAAALLAYAGGDQSLAVLIQSLPELGPAAEAVEADVLRWLEARFAAGESAFGPLIERWIAPDATPSVRAEILRENRSLLAR